MHYCKSTMVPLLLKWFFGINMQTWHAFELANSIWNKYTVVWSEDSQYLSINMGFSLVLVWQHPVQCYSEKSCMPIQKHCMTLFYLYRGWSKIRPGAPSCLGANTRTSKSSFQLSFETISYDLTKEASINHFTCFVSQKQGCGRLRPGPLVVPPNLGLIF